MTTLIPADNFEVKRANILVPFSKGLIQLDGFAIWDKANDGWVSINDRETVNGETIAVPYVLNKKRNAQKVIKDGLYEGYQIIRL